MAHLGHVTTCDLSPLSGDKPDIKHRQMTEFDPNRIIYPLAEGGSGRLGFCRHLSPSIRYRQLSSLPRRMIGLQTARLLKVPDMSSQSASDSLVNPAFVR